jgi:hypothetical protein
MHRLTGGVALIAMAGCAAMIGNGGPDVPAPAYQIGDRWIYHVEDGFRVKHRWSEVHEVTAVGPAGITVRVTQRDNGVDSVRTEQWIAPGQVSMGALNDAETRRFAIPVQRYSFPLAPGQMWNQWVDDTNESMKAQGVINRFVRVDGWERITTPAGTFDAIRLRVLMRLDDDDEFWRWPTTCSYVVWYAPSVRGVVREEREAEYREKGGRHASTVRTQHAVLELSAFNAGA